MHVLYVIGGKGLRYGAEVVAERIIENLVSQYGVKFTIVINSKGVISELCERLGIEYHIVKFRPYVYAKNKNTVIDYLKRKVLLLRANIEEIIAYYVLRTKIDFSDIDIVHTNLSRNMIGARMARKFSIPHIWYIQEMFDAHYKLSFLMKNQIEYMNLNADAFIAISETVGNDWIRHGIRSEKLHVILNGVEKREANFLKNNDVYKIVMVAELTPPKGQEFVIDALSKLTKEERKCFTLDFIGGGKVEYTNKLKDKVRERGLEESIRFLGTIENASTALSRYDILINASDGEGFGLSTAEAMMNSVCALVSDRGANVELINDKETGVIYKARDEISFTNSLKYLLDGSENERIANNAHEYALNHFAVERQTREVYDLYKQLAKEGKMN